MKKPILLIMTLLLILTAFVGCKNREDGTDGDINNAHTMVSAGNYFLDGNTDNACIQILNDTTLRLVNFDIEYLTYYIVYEGTDFRGQDAIDFMARQNLPDAFYEEIAFEFKTDNFLYLQVCEGEEGLTVNYRMEYIDKDSISFMENIYSRVENGIPTPNASNPVALI